jgi:hypothetical protein
MNIPIPKITVEDARQTTLDALRGNPGVGHALRSALEAIESASRAGKWHVIIGVDPEVVQLVVDELRVRGFRTKDMTAHGGRVGGNLGVSWSREVPKQSDAS